MNRRERKRRIRADIEGLERRRTPSMTGASIVSPPGSPPVSASSFVSTSPGAGDVVDAEDAPDALLVRLGDPELADGWLEYGLSLRRIGPDGTEMEVVEGARPNRGEALASDAGTVSVPIGEPLQAGAYRVILVGGSYLSQTLSQGRWDWTVDQTLSQFEVRAPAAAAGRDLGVIGPTLRSATGTLSDAEGDEATYRFRIPGGKSAWRLGLQVDAGRIGSVLQAQATIYNAAGAVVATTAGRLVAPSDYPNDPYLFVGLAPGQYTVVISKAAGSPGGAYRLELAADPATAPTRVTDFAVDRQAGVPVGFTIGFSDAIDPARLKSGTVEVVDASGKVHVASLVRLDPGLRRVGFEFARPLPPGDYRLLATPDGALVDLLGRSPVTARPTAGLLASWTIEPYDARPVPSGLSWNLAGGDLDLAPGASRELRLDRSQDGLVTFQLALTSGTVDAWLVGEDGREIEVATAATGGAYPIYLEAGSYVLRLTGVGDSTAVGAWSLDRSRAGLESLITNAVGAAGAIGLRFGSGREGATPGPAASGDARPAPELAPSALVAAVAAFRSGAGVQAGALWTAPVSGPIGRPTSGGGGGAAESGAKAAVFRPGARRAPLGIVAGIALNHDSQADDGQARGPAGLPEPDLRAAELGDAAVARASALGDEEALDRADRAIASANLGWLLEAPGPEAEAAEGAPAGPPARAHDAEADAVPSGGEGPSEGNVERASFELPLGLLLVTTSTYQLRRAILRWWRGRKGDAPAPKAARPLFRGPRRMTPSVRRAWERESRPT